MMESLLALTLPPGFYRNGTTYQAKGRWVSGNLIRFYEGTIRPVQGWRVASDNNGEEIPQLLGIPRAALGWRSATGEPLLAVGTTAALYVLKDGVTYDITPVDFTEGAGSAGSGGNGDYGHSLYGAGLYGIGRDTLAATLTDADTWQLDAIGDVLVAVCTNGGRLYSWTGDTGVVAAVADVSTPEPNRGVVITPERFVTALGAADDVRLVQWAAQASLVTWTPAADNTAGDFTLSTNGRIMCGRRTKAQTLIWTDADLHSMNYVGGDVIYSFKQEGDSCGIIAPQAVAIVDTAAIWMGRDNFFVYDGFVKPIPCDVHDHVFTNFNRQQGSKVFACSVSEFGEIWWFYPSGASEENDSYVVFNYRENHWTTGKLARTAAIDRGALPSPVMFDSTGTIYQHEQGGGTRTVPLPILVSDSLEDTDAVTLQTHTPDSTTAFTWVKEAGDDLVFDTNILRRDGATRPYYRAAASLGADDYEVSAVVHSGSPPFDTSNVAGVGARMTGTDREGYYFVFSSAATPVFLLEGKDSAGSDIFTAVSVNVPTDMLGADIELTLKVVGTTLTGYANGIQMATTTDATYATGNPGLTGSWPSAGIPTGYVDSFTDTDATVLTAHTPDGSSAFTWVSTGPGPVDITINANQAIAAGAAVTNARHTSPEADTTDGVGFSATVNVNIASAPYLSGGCEAGLVTAADPTDGYILTLNPFSVSLVHLRIWKMTNNGLTVLTPDATATAPRPAPGTYPLTINKTGSTLTATFNGTTVTGTDATYATVDRPAIAVKTDATHDFALESFGAGGATPAPNLGIVGPFSVRGMSTSDQEAGTNDGTTEFVDGNQVYIPFLESGPIELGDGDRVFRVQRIVPDEKNLGDVRMRFFTARFPTDTETERGPYTLTAPTSVRFTARQVRMRVEEVNETDWRVGTVRLGVIPGGRR